MNIYAGHNQTVLRCYELLDAAIAGGVHDFTDGLYGDHTDLPYQDAQLNQANWLLDQIQCQRGSLILDVGCGNGRILATAKQRGADAIGITISPTQVKRNADAGLSAKLLDYRQAPDEWNGRFDGLIANGSIEHFVQVEDAVNGRTDKIYQDMFSIFNRLLKPGGFLATTVIHFNEQVDPRQIQKGSHSHLRGSSSFHLSQVLLEDFGGWYPTKNQLIDDAEGSFVLRQRTDATNDYRLTSEYWLRKMKREIQRNPRVWWALLKTFARFPKSTSSMLDNLIISQSWMWQFRPDIHGNVPTTLFRDTWQKINN